MIIRSHKSIWFPAWIVSLKTLATNYVLIEIPNASAWFTVGSFGSEKIELSSLIHIIVSKFAG